MSRLVVDRFYYTRAKGKVKITGRDDSVDPPLLYGLMTGGTVLRYREDGQVIDMSPEDTALFDIMDMIDPNSDEANFLPSDAVAEATQTVVPPPDDPPELLNEDLIQAVLQGKSVQFKSPGTHTWEDLRNKRFALEALMHWSDVEFRLKPVQHEVWGVFSLGTDNSARLDPVSLNDGKQHAEVLERLGRHKVRMVRLVFDADGNVLQAEVRDP